MDIYRIIFFVMAVPTVVMLLIPKVAKYGALFVGFSFIPLGISVIHTNHDTVFGVGMFVLAAVATGRFVVDRVKRKKTGS